MSDVKWIKIMTGIFDDEKIQLIESLPSADSIITIWFKLLCLAGKTNNNGIFMLSDKIPYNDEMLSSIFHRDISLIRMSLSTFEKFGMIEILNDIIVIPNWEKYQNIDGMDKIREQNRMRTAKCREKQKKLLECNDEYHEIKPEECIQEKNKEPSKKELDDFFNSVWSLYPVKRGKGSVSLTKKKVLYRLGYGVLSKCVERYVTEQKRKGTDIQFYVIGSTFFNSRYVDYLDENYEEGGKVVGQARINSSKNFEQLSREEQLSKLPPSLRKQLESE